jgi:hypothetical protein
MSKKIAISSIGSDERPNLIYDFTSRAKSPLDYYNILEQKDPIVSERESPRVEMLKRGPCIDYHGNATIIC